MTAAVVQFRPRRGERDANLAQLDALVRAALARGARLVVLPEMAATGYRFAGRAAVLPVAEPADGPTFAAFSRLAREHGAWIVYGFPEADGCRLFNAAVAVGPRGERAAHYRKRLLYEDDWAWAEPGDLPYPEVDTALGVATIGICMDINDPRFRLHVRRTRPDIVCFPTNWIDEGIDDIHRYWIEQLSGFDGTLLAADRWGDEDGVRFWGRSAIIHRGRVAAQAPAEGDLALTTPPGRDGTAPRCGP